MCDHCTRHRPSIGLRLYPVYQCVDDAGDVRYSAVCRDVAHQKAVALGCSVRVEPRQDESELSAQCKAEIDAIYAEGV